MQLEYDPLKAGAMSQLQGEGDAAFKQNGRPELYEVAYKSDIEEKSMLELLGKLVAPLATLQELCHSEEIVGDNTREMLDSIRFLFKADHYREEKEVRVVQMLYQGAGAGQYERKIDEGWIPPRFYLEMPENFKFNEVILGPRASRVPDWQLWLKDQNVPNCWKSKIRYGKSD